jgi:UDP-3-O-[3-hydroxymyristoyl] glucosamine N-acyltransferase
MEFTLGQIAALIEGKVEGNENEKVFRLDKLQEGKPGGISFLANDKYTPHIYQTGATAVIVSNSFNPTKSITTNLIRVENAYTGFTTLLQAYSQLMKTSIVGVEEPSYMDSTSQMGVFGYRGAFSYIGKNCVIGDNVKIHPHAYVSDRVRIGDNTIISAGAKICADSVIGNNCEINPGAVLGADGFGFAPQEDGSYKSIPQIGNVILEDNVRIGANATIDCATMGSTIIRKGAKIDNLVQIAHNVEIGENTVVASQAGISGSTQVGKNCVIGGQVGVVGHIKIADHSYFGAKTGISKTITKPGQSYFGFIAMDMKRFLKSYSLFKNLESMEIRLRELEKKK